MTNSTSFGMLAEPPTLPCGDDVVVESGDAAPKLCLPILEIRLPTAAGGLVPTGETSKATEATVNEPRICSTRPRRRTGRRKTYGLAIPSAWYDRSFWKMLHAPSSLRVIETKPMQNRTFDPGGSQGRLRACPVLGSSRALLCGEVIRAGAANWRAAVFFRRRFAPSFEARLVLKMPRKNKSSTVEGGSR